MNGDDRNDQFDDLFEPFELSEPATPAPPPPAAPPTTTASRQEVTGEVPISQQHVTATDQTASAISCPACGAGNPSYNHHCERCGSRLSTDPMPIAPAPASRMSAGGRALGVLAAVVLVVALVALMMNIFGGDGGTDVVGPETTSSSSTSIPVSAPVEIIPVGATASSEYSDQFSAENLIDGNPETRWNDNSLRGVGAWLEFTFSEPVQITEMVFQNVEDDEAFKRNYKIQGYQIEVNDLNVPISGRLQNSNEPQRVKIASLETFKLKVFVTTTHLAEPVGELPPYTELALQDVTFFGYPATPDDTSSSSTTSTPSTGGSTDEG
ncbi:MAG: discoidin domain-containing protein [Acidimicrobiia bacterium]|nr:discoidin domain-containing protein [Acidimicrobiia bacterium]